MTKVAILGAGGRMGRTLVRCSPRVGDLKVVAAIELKGNRFIGTDAGAAAELPEIGVKISDDLKSISSADVAIDFCLHEAVPQHAALAAELGVPMVIGATGLVDVEREAVEKAAVIVPIVWAPNMSLGINLLFSIMKKAGQVLGPNYNVVIDETHHVEKKDAPSGTALRLGERIAEGLGVDFKKVMVHENRQSFTRGEMDEEQMFREYPDGTILIRSYREGEVIGDHTVTFANDGETIELTHHAWSREAFAMGALRAAQWVVTQRPGRIYDMQDVLGL